MKDWLAVCKHTVLIRMPMLTSPSLSPSPLLSVSRPAVKGTELQAIKSELTQIKANIEALLGRLEQITEDTHITATGDTHTLFFTVSLTITRPHMYIRVKSEVKSPVLHVFLN